MSKREIKFRIWTGEKMCYSDNVWAGSHGTVELLNIYTGYEDSDEWENYKVMQYTGLKDRGGTEIYEGDILENYHTNRVVRIYPFDTSGDHCNRMTIHYGYHLPYSGSEEWRIIGNIHEHPELLEQ